MLKITTVLLSLLVLATGCKKEVTPDPVPTPVPTTYYYPPVGSDTWETTSAATLGWDVSKLNEAITFAQSKKTYGLIILYKGRIVTENYWNGWDMNTKYPIASAGKSVTAFLVGLAQQDGILNINSRTSQYLGTGWTSAPPAKENLITVRHQLSMTTGLDEGAPDDNCITPACLQYKKDAGTQWYYYNAPYRLVQDVVANASGINYNQYTKAKLADKIGMKNYTWLNYILWLNSRDMARFGSLILSRGSWDGTRLMTDDAYFNAMTSSSNTYNLSYGYLWWLYGKAAYMVPGTTLVFPGSLAAAAPADMIAALGKGDKKIYVVPSKELVVIRHGDDTGQSLLGPSSFDSEFWAKLLPAIK
jgi:CubicO group peptidase (beta-lactamase class C family)